MRRFRSRGGLALLVMAVAAGILVATASSNQVTKRTINPAPAWSNAQLSTPPGDNWLTYFGDLSGDRYSSLNQITQSNVGTLKQVWTMKLGTCTAGLIAG